MRGISMKRIVLILLGLLFWCSSAWANTCVGASGGGNWTAAGTWTSCGSVAPTAADDVQLTSASGAVTIDSGAVGRSLDCTGYTGTLTHNAVTLNLGDGTAGASNIALTLVSGMTYTLVNANTSAITFKSTSTTQQTITIGGKTLGNMTINGASSSYLLQDTLIAAGFTHTAGTFNANGKTITTTTLSITGSGTRTLTLGAAAWALTTGGTATIDTGGVSNLTITANTATFTLSGAAAQANTGQNWQGASIVFSGSGASGLTGTSWTFANVTRTGTAVKTDTFIIRTGTVSSTFTVNGNSAINRVLVQQQGAIGTAATITAGTVTVTNADFRDITGAGAGSWDLSAITGGSGNCGGNSGITFTTAVTRYWVGGTGSWSSTGEWAETSGGASGATVPLSQDDVVFDASSFTAGSQTATLDMPRAGKNINWTGATNTPAWAKTTATTSYGSVTMISGMTNSGGTVYTFEGRGSFTFTSAGLTWTNPITIAMINGTLTLQDALTSSGSSITFNNGTFNANNFSVTLPTFVSSVSNTRTLTMGSGTWTLNGTGTVWNLTTTNLTFTANTATIVVSNTTTTAKTFTGGGATAYNNVTWSGDNITVGGSNTFGGIFAVNNGNLANGLKLTAGTTQTIGSLTSNGASGSVAIMISATASSNATLSDSSGTNCVNYMTLTDIVGTGGATWNVGANSTLTRTTNLNAVGCAQGNFFLLFQ